MNKLLISGIALCAFASTAFATAYSSYAEAFAAGIAAQKAKNFETMRTAFAAAKNLTDADSQKWSCLFHEVKACREMKKWDESLKLIDGYLAENPQESYKAAMIFVKGLVFNSMGDTDKGTALLEEAIASKELFGYMREQANFIVVHSYYQKKNLDKCIASAERILADTASPKSSIENARFYIAQCKLDQKKYDECEKFVKENASKVEAPGIKSRFAYIQASLHLQKQEYESAAKCFEEVLKLEPNGWRAINAKKQIEKIKNQ